MDWASQRNSKIPRTLKSQFQSIKARIPTDSFNSSPRNKRMTVPLAWLAQRLLIIAIVKLFSKSGAAPRMTLWIPTADRMKRQGDSAHPLFLKLLILHTLIAKVPAGKECVDQTAKSWLRLTNGKMSQWGVYPIFLPFLAREAIQLAITEWRFQTMSGEMVQR